MKALITGVTGQDGAYLSKLLVDRGYKVAGIFPRRSSKNLWCMEELGVSNRVEVIRGDVTDAHSIDSAIRGFQPDEVYNLAAQSHVGSSFECPASTFSVNAGGTLNVLEAIRRQYDAGNDNIKFYQASTSEIFGLTNVEGQNESTPLHPRSPYGVSKVAAYWATINYREAYGIHASNGILFNHESPVRGLDFVTRKVTDGVARIVAGKSHELVLGNMSAYRDWGYAGDFVEAMWLMLQNNPPSDYVISTGKAHSVREMVDYVFGLVGLYADTYVKINPEFMRPSDVPFLCGDSKKAEQRLGWKPRTTFEEMIRGMLLADLIRHGVKNPILQENKNVA